MPDSMQISRHIDHAWANGIVDVLHDYIRIPNVSPAYAADWAATGHMDRAVALISDWCGSRDIEGMTVRIQTLPGRTPLIVCEIPATDAALADDTVVLYGHLDKQPEMVGWRDGLGPWEPVLTNGRLYGRGGADDGYAIFASLSAIEALRANGGGHGRLLLLVEASEESGSPDLPAHLDALGDRLGQVSFVVALDSSCATYDRLWVTTSLRGNLIGDLSVHVLTEGVHSGSAGGVVPSSFRILRRLLDRVEDPDTGRVLVPELFCEIPAEREAQMAAVADEIIGNLAFPYAGSTAPGDRSPHELLRARTWEPSLAAVGIDGLPPCDSAGNVLRPVTQLTVSMRLAPEADPIAARHAMQTVLEADPPNGADVRFTVRSAEQGWNAPATAGWLATVLDAASIDLWGTPSSAFGEGGTIPFLPMLGRQFPEAQFLITGVLGPGANAHGPNEFLDIATAKRVAGTVALALDAHASRNR